MNRPSLVRMGPSIKYVTLFLANFNPLSSVTLCHTSRDPQSTSHISDPPIFSRPSTKNPDKAPCTNSLSIVSGGFCPGIFVRGVFCLEGFVRSPFCQKFRIDLLQQSVKHHFKFL